MKKSQNIIPLERIAGRIYLIRGEKVMLDSDLAELYGVTTGNLNKAVKRNLRRFPDDFIFQLTSEETDQILIFQTGRSRQAIHGGRRHHPHAFTEQGVAMLSSVLHSDRAADVNVAIMRTFVKLRKTLANNRDLARKVEQHDREIATLFETVQQLLTPPDPPKKHHIGYIRPKE
ncbi:MAG: ORF6N domain-containing protein [Proteobacteria bacterium]|nr:ORF6N domain-containing protein [Pseudomonadota bacterium]